MRNRKLLTIFLILIVVIIAGCSNSDDNLNVDGSSNNEGTTSTNNENDLDSNSNENGKSESSDNDNQDTTHSVQDNSEVLSLGETGIVKSTIGDYAITVNSFELHDEIDGESPMRDYFVLVEIEIENIGTSVLEGADVFEGVLFNDRERQKENTTYYDFIEKVEDKIEVGEKLKGKILFDQTRSDYYELIFNYALDTVATELTWRFNADEASNN